MDTPRKLPHKSVNPEFGLEVLKMDMEYLNKCYDYVLDQENSGDTIANHFESLTSKIFETAIARFFLEGISPDDFMEMLRKSSLAACNYFKLITNQGREILYDWEGERCEVIYESDRIHHMADSTLNMGLRAAIIANQNQEIEYLSNVNLSNLGLHMSNGAFTLRTAALQLLCNGNQKKYKVYFDAIEKLSPPSRNLDAKLMDSECKILLGLEKNSLSQLPQLMNDNLIIHKKMYDNDARNLRYNYFGLISTFNLTSLILAHKKRMALDVKSPYIPEELLKASIKNT
ncbi:Imm49 family immunity protein [Fulvivirgaceae bacterium BMA10]|uniref:Imm49 family immunity protein n=1 Tax=Splendidivirga corallicola TaxID=3051826 RepID=A0ABT8KU54_9BACT|nr:Imm49 family immunity protein [Fulvivirgaceae bacterium BMA10]